MLNGTNRNGTSNGVHKDAAIVGEHDLIWDGLAPAVTKALGQPLNPALVSQRRGRAGRTYSYIEGHTAIDEANRVFGFGGWGYEVVGDVTLRRIETVDSRTGEVKRVHAYSAPVRVTVPGAPPRTDVGFHTVADESGEGHETACKGAVTDGLKRALRSFGDRFGNGLYGDPSTGSGEPKPSSVGSSRPESIPTQAKGVPGNRKGETHVPTLRTRLVALGGQQGFDEDQVRAAVVDRMGKSLDDLTAAELAPLIEGATRKLQQMREAEAA